MNIANTLSTAEKRMDITTKMPRLGGGSSRTVYELEDGVVVKYAMSFRRKKVGIAQNIAEYKIFRQAKKELNILCPIISASKKRDCLIMPKAIVVNSKDVPLKLQEKFSKFKEKIKILNKLFWRIRNQAEFKTARDIKRHIRKRHELSKEEETIIKSKFFSQLCELITKYNLLVGDLVREDSWGYLNNKFVLIDYGCTVDVYNNYY